MVKVDVIEKANLNIAFVTIDDAHLNVLGINMIKELQNCLLKLKSLAKSLDFIVIGSTNKRAFCTGGDIKTIYANFAHTDALRQGFKTTYQLIYAINQLPVTTISFINGFTIGAGAGIAFNCDIQVAKLDLIVSFPEIKLGFFPDAGMRHILAKLPNAHGLYLALTGAKINLATAFKFGLINKSFDGDFTQFKQLLSDCNSAKDVSKKVNELKQTYTIAPKLEIFSKYANENLWPYLGECKYMQKCLHYSELAFKVTSLAMSLAKSQNLKACLLTDYRIIYRLLKNSDIKLALKRFFTKNSELQWSKKLIMHQNLNDLFAPLEQELFPFSENEFLD